MRMRRILFGSVGLTACAWVLTIIVWQDAPFAFTFDDAWYYFTIARNVSNGLGSTFDGINPTNGYHPLWLLICVPVFTAGFDGILAARILLLVQMAFWTVAMLIVASIVARSVNDWPRIPVTNSIARRVCTTVVATSFTLLIGNPFLIKVFVNGLESGIVVVGYAALLAAATQGVRSWVRDTSGRWRLGIGMVLVLTFLARTDAVLICATLGLWCLAECRPFSSKHLRPLVELFGPPALTISVYLAFNQIRFDSAIQISGIIKRSRPDATMLIGLVASATIALVVGISTFRRNQRGAFPRPRRFDRTTEFVRRTGFFAAFCVLIIGYYSFGQIQQWLWYYAPVALYMIAVGTVAVADFMESATVEARTAQSPIRSMLPLTGILVTPLVVAAVIQFRTFTDPDLRAIQIANRDAGVWINTNLPEDAVLASWDAGVVGYFSHRAVINLDGVVNSPEYNHAQRSGTTGEFLADRNTGWIVNHGTIVDGEDPEIIEFANNTFGDGIGGQLTLVESWPFTFSGTTSGNGAVGGGDSRQMAVFLYRLPAPPAPRSP